jgi:hypothetical protein
MFHNCIWNAIATPSPASSSGVVLTSVSAMALGLPKAPFSIAP